MSKKNTLNIYEVLEALNKKINNNTTLIENNNSKQERLVTEEFKKLKIDINNDLETLANNIMNSQIL